MFSMTTKLIKIFQDTWECCLCTTLTLSSWKCVSSFLIVLICQSCRYISSQTLTNLCFRFVSVFRNTRTRTRNDCHRPEVQSKYIILPAVAMVAAHLKSVSSQRCFSSHVLSWDNHTKAFRRNFCKISLSVMTAHVATGEHPKVGGLFLGNYFWFLFVISSKRKTFGLGSVWTD